MRLVPYLLPLAVALAGAHAAFSDPLPVASLPQDTRWVLHADVDAARAATPVWDLARRRIFEPRRDDLLPKLTVFERLTGMRPAQDLKDITLFGNTYDESAACIRIHGAMDKETLIAFLKGDAEFREIPHGTNTIVTWRDKSRDRLMYACFINADIALLASSAKTLEIALDTLEGKSPALAVTSPLLPKINAAHPERPILWIAGDNLAELPRTQKTESPVLAQMDAASIGVRWTGEQAALELHVLAKNDKAAQQMQSVAEGVKALVQLAAADDHAPPAAKLLGAAFNQLSVTASGHEVQGDWAVGLDRMEAVLDLAPRENVSLPASIAPMPADKKP